MPDGVVEEPRREPAAAATRGGDPEHRLTAMDEELARLQQSYRELLDNANDIIYTHDLHGNFLAMNARGEQILGYAPEEIVRLNIADILPPDQLALARSKIQTKADGADATTYEIEVLARGGETIPLEVSTRVIHRDGHAVGVQGIARDIRDRRAAQAALEASERRFRALIERSGDVKMLVDAEGVVRYVSPGGERVLGSSAEDRIGWPIFEIMDPADIPQAREVLARLAAEGGEDRGELRVIDRDGAVRWLAFTAQNAVDEPAIRGIVVNCFDVTERKHNETRLTALATFQDALISLAEESLQEGLSESFYGRVLRCAVEVIPGAQAGSLLLRESDGRCHFVAAEGFDLDVLETMFLFEHELHRVPDVPGPQIVVGFDEDKVEDPERSAVLFGAGRAAQIAATMSIPIELEGAPVAYFHLDNFEDVGAFAEDALQMARAFSNHIGTLLKRFRLEADLRQERAALDAMAYMDSLTGLPNRNMFYRRSRQALAGRTAASVAVLFFDLDAFKQVNDSLGHQFGDRLLEAVGKRLAACVRGRDTVSRWGGDEFVLLLPDAESRSFVEALARRIIERINAPFALDQHVITIGCSIGVALAGGRHVSIDELTREADIALYSAKEDGRNRYRIFVDGMRSTLLGRMALERDLHQAVDAGAFTLEIVPRVSLHTRERVADVARLMWNHPERGRVPIEASGSAVEQDAVARKVFARYLDLACAHAADGGRPVVVAMWPALIRVEELLATIADGVARHRLPAHRVELALSEATALRGPEGAHGVIRRLGSAGFRMSLSGYEASLTSLEALQQLPVDTLAIDRRLVAAICDPEGSATQQVLHAIVAMARALGMQTVADGIETPEHVECLEAYGFDQAQGVWFAGHQELALEGETRQGEETA